MNQQTSHKDFRQDERLKHLDSERMEFLIALAKELSDAPQDKKMPAFLSVMQKARGKNISFSAPEQDLLFSVLTEQMSPEEKKKAIMIRNLSTQMFQK